MRGRRFRRICATLVAVIGLIVIVALATGEVALVTTHGISMEPRFHTGDLAIVVPASEYHVGEIVGYHSPLLHIVVLHRIVAEHAGLFTFKGDNNNFLDPVKVHSSAIEGRLWARVPHAGIVLGWVRSPLGLGILGFRALLVRHGRRHPPPPHAPGPRACRRGRGACRLGIDRAELGAQARRPQGPAGAAMARRHSSGVGVWLRPLGRRGLGAAHHALGANGRWPMSSTSRSPTRPGPPGTPPTRRGR